MTGMDEPETTSAPEGTPTQTPTEAAGETYCYVHKKTPTKLSCSRCGNPICGRCAIPATVGQHCPDCVAEARKSAPKVKRQMPDSPVVMVIIAINVIMFVGQLYFDDTFTERLFEVPALVADGEFYRLFTAMFLHSERQLFHILFNMYILFSYGPFVEHWLGKVRFIGLYLLAGLMGSAVSYTFGEIGRPSLGASGAIFGVVGALGVLAFHMRGSAQGIAMLRGVVLFAGINLLFGFIVPGIDNNAHIGGLVGGALIAYALTKNPHQLRPVGVQVATYAGAALVVAFLVVRRTDDLRTLFPFLG
ncbi:MAG: rhomboid family intramembrane serine protease [Actinobacteria bacterium]|nr:rhomboid family intramembrane serine protease [Actinomycetota bacterium]